MFIVKQQLTKIFQDQLDNKFNQNHLEKVEDYITDLFDDTFKPNDYETLIDKMKISYKQKSVSQLKYFIENVSQKKHRLNNEPVVNYEENTNSFYDVRKSLEFSLTGKDKNPFKTMLRSELLNGEYLENRDTTYANKVYAKVKYLEYKNEEKEAYFLTWTLPSRYHKYKMKGGIKKDERHYEDFSILMKNPKYDFENFTDSIVEGLETLNKIHRYFYKQLKVGISRINKEDAKKIDFIKIIEPHKNLQGHQHLLIWVEEDYEDIVERARANTIAYFKLESDFQDIEYIDTNLATPTTYISKYLLKNLHDYEEQNFYNVYKRYFGKKTKFFSCSDFHEEGLTQQKMDIMYSYLKKNYPNKFEALYGTEKPIYIYLALMYKHKHFIFEEERNEVKNFNSKALKEDFLKAYEETVIETEEEIKELGFNSIKELIDFNYDNPERQKEIKSELLEKAKDKLYIEMLKEPTKYIQTINKKEIRVCFYKDKYIPEKENYSYNQKEPVYFKGQYEDNQIDLDYFLTIHTSANVDFNEYRGRKNFNG